MKTELTEQEVETEIEALLEDPDVILQKAVERAKNRRRQYLYSLRWRKRKGEELRKAGVTLETINKILNDDEEAQE